MTFDEAEIALLIRALDSLVDEMEITIDVLDGLPAEEQTKFDPEIYEEAQDTIFDAEELLDRLLSADVEIDVPHPSEDIYAEDMILYDSFEFLEPEEAFNV